MDAREIKQRYIDAFGEDDLPENVHKIFEAAASYLRKNDAVGFEAAMEGITGLTGEVKYNLNKVLNLKVPDDEIGIQNFRGQMIDLMYDLAA